MNKAHSTTSFRSCRRRTGSSSPLTRKKLVRRPFHLDISRTIHPLSIAYYVAFGPHGPRTPISKPGDNWKIAFWVSCAVGMAGLISFAIRSNSKYTVQLYWPLANLDILNLLLCRVSTEDAKQRVAGSLQRSCDRAKDEPHHWYAFHRLFTPPYADRSLRYLVGRIYWQGVRPIHHHKLWDQIEYCKPSLSNCFALLFFSL